MCKSFGSSLVGPALQWFINLPKGRISSFAQLQDAFSKQFSSSKKSAKVSDDLYEVVHDPKESLKSYIIRFNHEMIAVSNYNVSTALSAFKRSLLTDGASTYR